MDVVAVVAEDGALVGVTIKVAVAGEALSSAANRMATSSLLVFVAKR
jgi:hypothetical protein